MSGIVIEANVTYIKEPDFTNKINKALALLKSKATSDYSVITKVYRQNQSKCGNDF